MPTGFFGISAAKAWWGFFLLAPFALMAISYLADVKDRVANLRRQGRWDGSWRSMALALGFIEEWSAGAYQLEALDSHLRDRHHRQVEVKYRTWSQGRTIDPHRDTPRRPRLS